MKEDQRNDSFVIYVGTKLIWMVRQVFESLFIKVNGVNMPLQRSNFWFDTRDM